MKCCEVLKLLNITRPTLSKYVKDGKIKVALLPNGYYDYDKDSVYSFLNANKVRKNVIYARTTNYVNDSSSLKNQVEKVKSWCEARDIDIAHIFEDVSSSFNLKRRGLNELIELVSNNEVNTVYVLSKDKINVFAYDLLQYFFSLHKTNIVFIEDRISEREVTSDILKMIESLEQSFTQEKYRNVLNKLTYSVKT